MIAIPWFLTLFAHVLSLEKIYRLWDAFLLQEDEDATLLTLPLYFSIAFMKQIRSKLLHSDFNSMKLYTDAKYSNFPNLVNLPF